MLLEIPNVVNLRREKKASLTQLWEKKVFVKLNKHSLHLLFRNVSLGAYGGVYTVDVHIFLAIFSPGAIICGAFVLKD